jgi:hypothetical protein
MKNVLLLLLVLYSTALAQYSLTRFDLAQLSAIPGPLVTSTNFSAILKFESPPQTKITARSDLISVELQNDLIIVRANVPSGSTDLTVPVAGEVARFTVVIDESISHSHYYEITSPESMTLGGPDETNDTQNAATPVEPSEPGSQNPGDPPFRLTLTPNTDNPRQVDYLLESYSPYYLIADGQQLSITTRGGQLIAYTLSERQNSTGALSRVAPGHQETGTILLSTVPNEPLTLTWTIVETVTAQTFAVEKPLPTGGAP